MKLLKCFFLCLLFVLPALVLVAQTDSGSQLKSNQAQQRDTPLLTGTPAMERLSDSLRSIDSVNQLAQLRLTDSLRKDSLQKALQAFARPYADTSTYRSIAYHPFLPLTARPIYMISDFRERRTLDDLFYLLMGVLLLLAFIKTVFARYFRNLFVLFFQTSLRQRQTRDQLLQDNLGSLFSNMLFVISTSIYAALVVRHQQILDYDFWQVIFFGAGLLASVYLGKFLFMQFAGWVFNSREAASNYTFVVFLVNKVLGVILIPFLLLLAFATPTIREIAVSLSLGTIIILFLYRYVVSFGAIRNTLKVNALHFLLYLCAVEVLPLMLLYKLMTDFIGGRV